ncbi:MAG: carbonic anhydrase [Oscillospiraceae bacterium]|nr:carbonic anhydrase [Oscillospiraceae bacterium]
MKISRLITLTLAIPMAFAFAACGRDAETDDKASTPEQVIAKLVRGNEQYQKAIKNNADISNERIKDTADNGQSPYAVIVTCSDSRVPPEHIFLAGIGDLFVIRTAGNVVGDFELGSIEYGVKHLGAKVVVVLGHTKCGAVSAAMGGHAEGYIESIVDEIKPCIQGAADATQAEKLNIAHSYDKILTSEIVSELSGSGEIAVIQAVYDIATGKVELL